MLSTGEVAPLPLGGCSPPALAFSSFCKNNPCASDHCRRPDSSDAAAPLLRPGPLPPRGLCPVPSPCHWRPESRLEDRALRAPRMPLSLLGFHDDCSWDVAEIERCGKDNKTHRVFTLDV